MTTAADCQTLKAKIDEMEDALDDLALTGGVRESSDGNQRTSWNGPNETRLKRRLAELRTKYSRCGCPAILGEKLDAQPSKGPIRPRF